MAHVRAEILAASRSRTGWRDMPSPNDTSSNCRPFISNMKTNYENGTSVVTLEKVTPICTNKTETSPIKRSTGAKVSTIANMFQQNATVTKDENVFYAKPGFVQSPEIEKTKKMSVESSVHKNKRKPLEENTIPAKYKSDSLSRNESHLTRFNNARAMFERLEEQSACSNVTSPVGRSRRSGSGSSSPSRTSPLRSSPSSPFSHSFEGTSPRRNSSSSSSSTPKEILSPLDRSHSTSVLPETSEHQKRKPPSENSSGKASSLELHLDLCHNQDNSAPSSQPTAGQSSPRLSNSIPSEPSKDQTGVDPSSLRDIGVVRKSDKIKQEHSDNLNDEASSKSSTTPVGKQCSASEAGHPSRVSPKRETNARKDSPKRESCRGGGGPYSWQRCGSNQSAANYTSKVTCNLRTNSNIPRRRPSFEEEKQKSQIPSLVSARERLGVAGRKDFLIKPPNRIGNVGSKTEERVIGSSSITNETSVAKDTNKKKIEENSIEEKTSANDSNQSFVGINSKEVLNSLLDAENKSDSGVSSAPLDDNDDILRVSEDGIELITSSKRNECENQNIEVNGNIIDDRLTWNKHGGGDVTGECEKFKSSVRKDKLDKERENMMVMSQEKMITETSSNHWRESADVPSSRVVDNNVEAVENCNDVVDPPALKVNSDWRRQLFPDLDNSSADKTRTKLDHDNLPESRVDDVIEEDVTVVSGHLSYPEIILRGMCHESATNVDDILASSPHPIVETSVDENVTTYNEVLESVMARELNKDDTVEEMTAEEADKFLSTNKLCGNILSDEEAKEIAQLLSSAELEKRVKRSQSESTNETSSSHRSSDEYELNADEIQDEDGINEGLYNGDGSSMLEDPSVYLVGDGHYYIEIEGLAEDSDEDFPSGLELYCKVAFKKRSKVKFSTNPIKVFSTHAVEDYDRRNEDVDPVSASAEYELEKRIEKMDVFPVNLVKGPEGLGLSIIGMGVGADSGLEKLGIFVKTITEGGAAQKDGHMQVNDQIIEVDGKSLVGVTQSYAASVLRNTCGLVKFLIGREKDAANSEVAQLISQSLEADREREFRRRSFEQELAIRREESVHDREIAKNESLISSQDDDVFRSPSPAEECKNDANKSLPPIPLNSHSHESVSAGTPTPEEGDDLPTCEVYDAEDATSSDYSLSPTSDRESLAKNETPNSLSEADVVNKSRTSQAENVDVVRRRASSDVEETAVKLELTDREINKYRALLESSQGQVQQLEKKYYKAKKIIKAFQSREKDLLHREEFHFQQTMEKDQEYNLLVKTLKDRVILLEHDLAETQRVAGLPVKLPYDRPLQVTPQLKKKYPQLPVEKPLYSNKKLDDAELSDADLSDIDLSKCEISPDSDDCDAGNRTSTVERKPFSRDENFDKLPEADLLDSTAAKSKAELASKGGLANRQPPTLKKQSSTDSAPSFEQESENGVDAKSEDVIDIYKCDVEESLASLESEQGDGNCSTGSGKSCKIYNSFTEEIKAAVAERHAKVARQMSESDNSVREETDYEAYQREYYRKYYEECQKSHSAEQSPYEPSHRRQQQQQRPPQSVPKQTENQIHPNSQTQQHQLYSGIYNVDERKMADVGASFQTRHTNESNRASLPVDPINDKSRGYSSSSTSSVPSVGGLNDDRVQCEDGVVLLSQRQKNASLPRQGKTPVAYNGTSSDTPSGMLDAELSPPNASKSNKYQFNEESSDLESSYNSSTNRGSVFNSSLQSYEGSRKPNQWQSGPVMNWGSAQVGQWLLALGMEQYIPKFIDSNVDGHQLLHMDSSKLKSLGVCSSNDRSVIKRKIKDMKVQTEKERKQQEKEMKNKEKLAKKAEKAAIKGNKKK